MIAPRSRMHVGLLALSLVNMLPALEAEDAWQYLALACGAAIFSFVLSGSKWSDAVRPSMITTGVLCSVIYTVYEMFLRRDEAPVYILNLAHFMILLSCCKYFELRTARDAGIIVLMAFLLLIIGAFVSASLLFAGVVLVDLTIGVAWLLEFQSRCETQRVALSAERIRPHAAPTSGIGEGQAPALRSRLTGALGSTLSLAVVGLVVFIAIPRGWSTGLFGRMHRMVPTAVSGFTDEITLRDTAIFEDPTPVMRVRFTQAGRVLTDEDFRPLMRGSTMDRYVRGRWERTHSYAPARRHAQRGISVEPLFNVSTRYVPTDLLEQDITLFKPARGNLFAAYPPVYFGSDDLSFLQQDPIDLALHTPQVPQRDVRYFVYSLHPDRPAFNRRIEFAPRTIYRRDEISVIAPRVVEFAVDLCRDFGNALDPAQREAIASRIEEHFARGPYVYTLSRGRPPHGVDPVEDFLYASKKGHCEYFASAMAVVCQAANIPARLVTGFAGGEFDPASGTFQFRQKDAHAWVEVFIPEKGWIPFDPTPVGGVREADHEGGLWARAARWVDLMRAQWSSSVVLFDANRRGGLLAHFGNWFRALGAGGQDGSMIGTIKAVLMGPEMIRPVERVMYWLLLVLIVVLLAIIVRVVWLTALIVRAYLPSPSGPASRRMRRADARFYDRLLALLENKGHAKPATLTPLEFARRLARSHRDLSEMPTYVHWFYDVQFGDRALPRDHVRQLNGFLQRLRDDPAFGTR